MRAPLSDVRGRRSRPGPARRAARLLIASLAAAVPVWPGLITAQNAEIIRLDPDAGASIDSRDETAAEVVPLPAQGVDSRQILSGLWFRHQAMVERQETLEAERLVSAALDFMRREGFRAAPEIAAAFYAKGRRNIDDKDFQAAKGNFGLAMSFDPNLTAAHRGLAGALLRGDRDLFGSLGEWWLGVRAVFDDPESLYLLIGNGVLIVYLGLVFGTTAALLLLGWRSAPALIHDLQERTAGKLSETTAQILGWTILAAPLIAPIPPAWTVAIWGALLFAYLRAADRIIAVVALVLLLAAGPTGRFLTWHFGTATDPAARTLLQLIRTGPNLRHEDALKRVARERPEDPLYPFLLASAFRAGGRFEEAMEMYRRTLEIDSAHARAMINLGNLHALQHEFGLAQNLYKRAAESDPALALAHYNSHLAHLENFSMEDADEALREARRVDEVLVADILVSARDEEARRTPRDTTYESREIWGRAVSFNLDGPMKQTIARALTASSTVAGGAGLLVAFLLPGIGLTPRAGPARRCRRCGRPFCKQCQVATKYPDYCSQCVHLFILRDGLAPNIRARKLADVERHRRLRFLGTRILSLLVPGSGHVIGGRALVGGLLLVVWFATWARITLDSRLLALPGSGGAVSVGGLLLAPFLVALGVWLLANLSAQERFRS